MNFSSIVMMLIAMQTQSDLTIIPCSTCHTPASWSPLLQPVRFDHSITLFPLEGKHKRADCVQCHWGDNLREIHRFESTSMECTSCHYDIHSNEFGSDCQRCHGYNTWDMSNWRNEHETTLFPLSGAHALLECKVCHGKEYYWLSGILTDECKGCHLTIYQKEIDKQTHPENDDCFFCHNTRAWLPIDHGRLFPIYSGEHRGVWADCTTECHIDPTDYSNFSCGLGGVCHKHDENKMDNKHRKEGSSGYRYESQACYNCHPTGGEGDD